MKVTSTRSNILLDSSKAILKGISDDKGLFIFKDINMSFFNNSMVNLTYQQLTEKLFEYLLDDYSHKDITRIVEKAYNNSLFNPDIVTLEDFDNYSILSLFNGPTFAFKDMALSILPNLLSVAKEMENNERPTLILTATSGDTGSAALSGFSQNDNTYVIVLYPTTGVSEFQELQMNSFQSDRNFVFAVDGNFDDCQTIVKKLFQDVTTTNIDVSSANSINIGRLVPQIVYYLYSYLKLAKHNTITFGDKINITVPSGNFGNIYAAYLAKQLGVPVNKLIIASNENNVLTELFTTGLYQTNRTLKKTSSPSMDILISSNVERYFYSLFGGDSTKTKSVMDELLGTGKVFVKEILEQDDFYANYCTETETINEIKIVLDTYKKLIDPHTAVAMNVYKKYLATSNDKHYNLIVSTASPFKFSDAIYNAINLNPKMDLQQKLKHLSDITSTPIDDRILEAVSRKKTKKALDKTNAYFELKRLIGEIDVKN